MKACQTHGNLRSPHSYVEEDDAFEDDSVCSLETTDCEGIVDCLKKSIKSEPLKLKQGMEQYSHQNTKEDIHTI